MDWSPGPETPEENLRKGLCPNGEEHNYNELRAWVADRLTDIEKMARFQPIQAAIWLRNSLAALRDAGLAEEFEGDFSRIRQKFLVLKRESPYI